MEHDGGSFGSISGSNYIPNLPKFPSAAECSYGARLGSSVCSRGNALNSTHRPDVETLTQRASKRKHMCHVREEDSMRMLSTPMETFDIRWRVKRLACGT